MAFPLIPIIAALATASKAFGKRPRLDYELPPDPEFFGPGFDEIRAALKQKTQAQYGGGVNDLREILANQGVLGNQGALTDAFTRMSISQGQDIASGDAALTGQEYGAQKEFDAQKYRLGYDRNRTIAGANYEADAGARENELGFFASLGGDIGKIFASPGAPAAAPSVPLPSGIPGPVPIGGKTSPGLGAYGRDDPFYGTGFGLEKDKVDVAAMLRKLFGYPEARGGLYAK